MSKKASKPIPLPLASEPHFFDEQYQNLIHFLDHRLSNLQFKIYDLFKSKVIGEEKSEYLTKDIDMMKDVLKLFMRESKDEK